MAGIAIILDLLGKYPSFSGQTLHSYGIFSAKIAASAAAASIAATSTSFASRSIFGKRAPRIALCDAVAALDGDDFPAISESSDMYWTKEYYIELKPLFSAFHWKTLTLTSLRSFLLFYLPLLEPHANTEEDEDEFLSDSQEARHVDLVVPFKKSIKQIVRESSVVTVRRILERVAVCYASQRMAWKLIKDVPRSAARKAVRGMPTMIYFYSVSRTTFRGHLLGVLASWIVQVGLDAYRCFSSLWRPGDEGDEIDQTEEVKLLGRKVYITTARCGSSLVFASIGAGIGAMVFRPSTGQWIGCAIGDLAGPVVLSFCAEKYLHATI